MKKKNYLLSVVACATVFVMVLTGCSQSSKAASTDSRPSEAESSTSTSSVAQEENENETGEFWSFLNNLEFAETPGKTDDEVLWATSIPIGEDPLEYKNGAYAKFVKYGSGSGYMDIGLSVEQGKGLVQGTEAELVPEYSEDQDTRTFDVYYCLVVGAENEYVRYYPAGCWADGDVPANELSHSYPTENSMTMSDIFANGLYYSVARLSQFENAPSEDSSAEEQLAFLVDYFGTPTGLYWGTLFDASAMTIIEDHDKGIDSQAKTYEDFLAAPNRDEVWGSAKAYYIMWQYDNCWVAAYCSDGDNESGTVVRHLELIPAINYENVSSDAVYHDENSIVYDGYKGYGYVPGVLRLGGQDLLAGESKLGELNRDA